MGASFCTVFEANVPPHGTLGGDNPALLRRQRRLDRLAVDGGLTPLGAFVSYDPADTAGFLDEAKVVALPPARWFAAADGLAAVNGLLDYLAAHPDDLPRVAEIVDDLTTVAAELAAAVQVGVRFRFAVVP